MKNNSCAILALLTITKHINICDVTIKRFSFAFVFFFLASGRTKFPFCLIKIYFRDSTITLFISISLSQFLPIKILLLKCAVLGPL